MGRLLVAGEPGNQIVAELAPVDGEIVIDKPGKGMFWATGLHETLRPAGITHLVFAGVTTEVCVQTSMREANDRGYECLLIEDATESYFPEFKAATIEMIVGAGRHRRLGDAALRSRRGIRGGDGPWLNSAARVNARRCPSSRACVPVWLPDEWVRGLAPEHAD